MTYIYIPIFIFILYLDIERFHYFYFGRKCLKDKNLFWKPGVPLFIWKFTVNPISKYKTILLKEQEVQIEQEVGDGLGVCVLKLQIV